MAKQVDTIDDFDFGFTFAADTEPTLKLKSDTQQQLIDDLTNRIDALYQAIIPLLDNLCKDPDKPTILWPDRVAKIEQFKNNLRDIVEGTRT